MRIALHKSPTALNSRDSHRGLYIGARNGIPKNLSSQVFGEVQVNFWGGFLLKPFILGDQKKG